MPTMVGVLCMYNKINTDVLLIECGFISNANDRTKLTNEKFQEQYSKDIAKYISNYFKYELNKIS